MFIFPSCSSRVLWCKQKQHPRESARWKSLHTQQARARVNPQTQEGYRYRGSKKDRQNSAINVSRTYRKNSQVLHSSHPSAGPLARSRNASSSTHVPLRMVVRDARGRLSASDRRRRSSAAHSSSSCPQQREHGSTKRNEYTHIHRP